MTVYDTTSRTKSLILMSFIVAIFNNFFFEVVIDMTYNVIEKKICYVCETWIKLNFNLNTVKFT